MWLALIKRYWRVSTFQVLPADTPYSLFLLSALSLIFFLLIVLQWMLADVEHPFTLIGSLLSGAALILSYSLYTYVLLSVFHLAHRTVQALTCLFAGHTMVHIFALPLLLATPLLAYTQMIQPLAVLIGVVYLLVTLVLTVWQFLITVYIYKHALGIDNMPAILASLGLLACNVLIVSIT